MANKATEFIGDEQMSYTSKSKVDPAIAAREIEMLKAGRSYAEISQDVGSRHKSISERNRLVYRIDIQAAFAARVEREGVPNRLSVSDAFGYWFSGFFDGEGCFSVFSRMRPGRYAERRVGIQIMLRDDDVGVILSIKQNLNAGLTYATSKPNGRTNPKATFRVEQINDLAEVIVPLFEKYPLRSKKGREFPIWRSLVRSQYVLTMGGYSQRASCTAEQNAAFDAGREAIRQIRTYRPAHRIAEIDPNSSIIA